jgi:hypothetical protein
MTTQRERIEATATDVRSRFTLDAYIRRAIAEQINSQWALSLRAEQADRADRAETMMSTFDYHFAKRYLLHPAERDKARAALAAVPTNIRSDLELQASRLATGVYRHLGAEERRRMAEVRCMLADAIMHLDALEFSECKRQIVDADHAINYLLSAARNADRATRRKLETDTLLRERLNVVSRHLRADAAALRSVAL